MSKKDATIPVSQTSESRAREFITESAPTASLLGILFSSVTTSSISIPPLSALRRSRRLPWPLVRLVEWVWAGLWFFFYFLLALVLPSLWHFTELICNKLLTKFLSILSGLFATQSRAPEDAAFQNQSWSSCLPIWDDPELSPKIRDACAIARANGFRYIWIDSCCIDKSSSSELSEAINSMYSWYARAVVCYAYLADVAADEDHRRNRSRFRESRWFTRGWTLQELIAPLHLEFLAEDWTVIGSKHALVDLVQSVTKIEYKALLHLEPLDKFSVAQRLSWASDRKTTRVEDQAYSLLGIFNINMPTLYGEGEGAFRRLQEEIMRRIPDQSLFAWGRVSPGSHILPEPDTVAMVQDSLSVQCVQYPESDSLLAVYPRNFQNSGTIGAIQQDTTLAGNSQSRPSHAHEIEYTSSPYGIRTKFRMIPISQYFNPSCSVQSESPEKEWFLAILECEHKDHPGHLLGRVCYISPSPSGVDFLYPGYLLNSSFRGRGHRQLDFLSLSAETVERCRPHTQLRTVHVSHPSRAPVYYPTAHYRPHKTIQLVLLKETSDALRARGYAADVRAGPSLPAAAKNPTGTHRLTLSNRRHTIAVEFQHTIWDSGERFTIDASVKVSRSAPALVGVAARARPWSFHGANSRSGAGSTPTVSWSHASPWSGLGHQRVTVSPAGTQVVTVDLGLDFAGMGVYFLRVDVLSDPPPRPALPSANLLVPRRTEQQVSGILEANLPNIGGDELEGRGSGIRASWIRLAFWRPGKRGDELGRSVVGGADGGSLVAVRSVCAAETSELL